MKTQIILISFNFNRVITKQVLDQASKFF